MKAKALLFCKGILEKSVEVDIEKIVQRINTAHGYEKYDPEEITLLVDEECAPCLENDFNSNRIELLKL